MEQEKPTALEGEVVSSPPSLPSHPETPEEPEVIANRRSDWKKVHRKVQKAIIQYYNDNKAFPSYREIVKLTGLELKTVYNHMKELDSEAIVEENLENLRMMGDQLFMAIYQTAMKGNTTAQQMLLNGVFGFSMPSAPLVAQQNNFYNGNAANGNPGGANNSTGGIPLEPDQVDEVNTTLDNLLQIAEFRKKRELPPDA